MEARRLREHPLVRRLPLLLLVAMGLWLWQSPSASRRTVTVLLSGSGWGEVRALDLQISGADGALIARHERFFSSTPPAELTFEVALPVGVYPVRAFPRAGQAEALPPLRAELHITEEGAPSLRLLLPPSR